MVFNLRSTMKPSRALLLDVDGVVLNQPRVMTRVSYKVCSYVMRCVPKINNLMQAMDMNTMLYTSFGHTQIGLKTLYGKHAPSLKEFNEAVYDDDLLTYLGIHESDDILMQRGDKIRSILIKAHMMNIPCYIFSNAPDVWCNKVLEMLSMDEFIPMSNRLSSSHPVFEDFLLKPDHKLYENVATFIQQTHRDKSMELLFVDDSFTNIIPVINNHIWKPVLLKDLTSRVQSENLHIIKNIDELSHLI